MSPASTTTRSSGADGRRKPRQARAQFSHESIVNGARKLLAEDGFEALTMRRLATKSGVGLGTIYDYFSGSASIIRVLLTDRLALRENTLAATFEEVSAERGLSAFVPTYLRSLQRKGFWSRYDVELEKAARSDDELSHLLDEQNGQIARLYVAEMQRAGSSWPLPKLMQVARVNMNVSQMIAPLADDGPRGEGDDALRFALAANMIRANLFMILKPPPKPASASETKHAQ